MSRRPLLVAAALSLVALGSPARTAEIALPGPAPRPDRSSSVALSDESCVRCHRVIGAEWAASRHRGAWSDPYFQATYSAFPDRPFCRGCHAPEADPRAEPGLSAQASGVGCVSCHLTEAGITGAHGRVADPSAHAVVADPRRATGAACAGCHDFDFPGPSPRTPMQSTHAEHAASSLAPATCQSCHMPAAASSNDPPHLRHDFRVETDPALLRSAVQVSARLGPDAVVLTLSPGAIGHALPTGDVHRRVEVRAFAVDAAGRPVGPPSVHALERKFGLDPGKPGFQRPLADDRLAAPGRGAPLEIRLPLAAATSRARWQIAWQRMPPAIAASLGGKVANREVVFLEGLVNR